MKVIRFFLFFFSFVVTLQIFAFDFAKDGKPLCVIGVPENCSDLEIMAKDDLAMILEKITGAKFQVVPEVLADSVEKIMPGGTRYDEVQQGMEDLRSALSLGHVNAAANAARIICETVDKNR